MRVLAQGGYWCYDSDSCKERYAAGPTYMSSTNAEDSYTTDGIFTDAVDADSKWADANLVMIKCAHTLLAHNKIPLTAVVALSARNRHVVASGARRTAALT